MNTNQVTKPPIVAPYLSQPQTAEFPFWKRLLISIAMIFGVGIASWGTWVFGMLMFAFSLDGASSSDIPSWMEVYMLIGWGVVLVIATLVPAMMLLFGVKGSRCVLVQILLWIVAVAWPVIGWVCTMVAIH